MPIYRFVYTDKETRKEFHANVHAINKRDAMKLKRRLFHKDTKLAYEITGPMSDDSYTLNFATPAVQDKIKEKYNASIL